MGIVEEKAFQKWEKQKNEQAWKHFVNSKLEDKPIWFEMALPDVEYGFWYYQNGYIAKQETIAKIIKSKIELLEIQKQESIVELNKQFNIPKEEEPDEDYANALDEVLDNWNPLINLLKELLSEVK